MSLKELATGFVAGAVTVFAGPTILSWLGVMLPSLSFGMMPAAAMEGEYYGYEGEDYFSQAARRAMRAASLRSRGAMGIRRGYEGEYDYGAMEGEADYYGYPGARSAIGRTVTVVPRAAGRAVASHTGNTIGYSGDLRRSPGGAFSKLSHPGLTGSVSRLNRF